MPPYHWSRTVPQGVSFPKSEYDHAGYVWISVSCTLFPCVEFFFVKLSLTSVAYGLNSLDIQYVYVALRVDDLNVARRVCHGGFEPKPNSGVP